MVQLKYHFECLHAQSHQHHYDANVTIVLQFHFSLSNWYIFLLQISSFQIRFSPCRSIESRHSFSSSLTSTVSSTASRVSSPPMFTIAVNGAQAEREAVTCVSFVGSTEPVTVKVTLPLPHNSKGTYNNQWLGKALSLIFFVFVSLSFTYTILHLCRLVTAI